MPPEPPPASSTPAPIPAPARSRTRVLGLVVIAAIVAATGWPVFERPQLAPDDYRYLSIVQQLMRGDVDLSHAFLVENGWEHLWWLDVGGTVRFFRPTVLVSFLCDGWIHGGRPAGCLATNLLLHFSCCALVLVLLFRLVRVPIGALVGGILFACFACHAEAIWYGSGRTATLAALGFLGGLVLHSDGRSWLQRLAPLAYGFALLSKESTLGLPLVCLAWDRWRAGPGGSWRGGLRERRKLYLAYAVVAGGYLIVRSVLLAKAGGSIVVFPYFVAPWTDAFPGHLWTQVRNYTENLFAGQVTDPFLTFERLGDYSTLAGGWIALIGAVLLIGRLLRREPAFRVIALAGLLTWLPASVVYVSERYLYLPSFALAGALALFVASFRSRPRWLAVAAVVGLAWSGHQGWWLYRKVYALSVHPRPAYALGEQWKRLPRQRWEGKELLFVDFPGDWVHAQFLQDQLRVQFDLPELTARVLSVLPAREIGPSKLVVERRGAQTWRLRAERPLIDGAHSQFPLADLRAGNRVSRPGLGFSVEIVEGDATSARCIDVRPEPAPGAYVLVRFLPPPRYPGIAGAHVLMGRFVLGGS